MKFFAVQFSGNIDLGQLIIAILVGVLSLIGKLIKNEVTSVKERLRKHDEAIVKIGRQVQMLIGYYYAMQGYFPKEKEKNYSEKIEEIEDLMGEDG